MNAKLIKLAKLVMKFATLLTDKAELIYNGDVEVGVEVFIEDEAGEIVPAADGDYTAEDMVITVAEGVITEVKPVEEPEEPAELAEPAEPANEPDEEEFAEPEEPAEPAEPEVDENQKLIDELTATIAEKDAQIADLQLEIEQLKAELAKANEPVVEPVKMNKVAPTSANDKSNPALKYFQK